MSTQTIIQELLLLMEKLRTPDFGCPWDIEQTFNTIAPLTLEEAYEVVDAIECQDYESLKDELADLLLHVIYYAQMAKESKLFDFHGIAQHLRDKMIRRHPHVFNDEYKQSQASLNGLWEKVKAEERAQKNNLDQSQMAGVAMALPALMRAQKIQNRAKQIGFDWPNMQGALDKITEELNEVKQAIDEECPEHIQEEIGDLLFSVVNLARFFNVNAEYALKQATTKFENRFRAMEKIIQSKQSMKEMSLAELDKLWESAKLTVQ